VTGWGRRWVGEDDGLWKMRWVREVDGVGLGEGDWSRMETGWCMEMGIGTDWGLGRRLVSFCPGNGFLRRLRATGGRGKSSNGYPYNFRGSTVLVVVLPMS